jgi:hypothetical protein
LLFGPVVIGAVAQAANLTAALSVVAICAALVAAVAPKVLAHLKI